VARFLIPSILIVAFASGCGNSFKTNVLKATTGSGSSASGQYLLSEDGTDPLTGQTADVSSAYSCPAKANVAPDYDWEFNGSFFFKACPSKNNTSDLHIDGWTPNSSTICIFPAMVYSQTRTAYIPHAATGASDLQAGQPEVQCKTNGTLGVNVSFAGMTYNAVFVVELPDVAKMQTCLLTGNYFLCPRNYSFGQFR
jgi:hypothetical protein